ncbi:MAG: DUF5057 domain-containing protein, partial [Clostridium sp.]|nr:DUF5057 domain-containing protein [Clostridium sp.]
MKNKILCLLVILIFFIQISTGSTQVFSAVKSVSNNDIQVNSNTKVLNLLEVEPGKNFAISKDDFDEIGNYKVNITQMSMPEFISNIENINGKYDIVYIGDNVNGGIDYSYLGPKSARTPSGIPSTEYYSENDITNKKAKELIDYIKSGQTFLLSDKIISDIQLSKTKLFTNLSAINPSNNKPWYSQSNCMHVRNRNGYYNYDYDSVDVNSMINFYNNHNTRPNLKINAKPQQYDGTAASYLNNKELKFNFDANNNSNHPMTFKLFLDFNGDGLYTEKQNSSKNECVQVLNKEPNGSGYTFDYRIGDEFCGLMPWKLEVTDETTGAKTYELGSVAFNAESKVVRVLQIDPYNDSQNATNTTFSIGNDLKVPLRVNNEYNLQITEINISDLNKSFPNNVRGTVYSDDANGNKVVDTPTGGVTTKLNGNYDMIVLGFADMYGNNDGNGSDITNPEVIKEIKSFIKTG